MHSNVKDKNKNTVTEKGIEPATSRFIVIRLNQLVHRGNCAHGVPTMLTIIWYLAPFFSRIRPKSVTVSRSSRAQYVFLISQPRVFGPKTEHESFSPGRWSRVCGWIICEKQKKPPLTVKSRNSLCATKTWENKILVTQACDKRDNLTDYICNTGTKKYKNASLQQKVTHTKNGWRGGYSL